MLHTFATPSTEPVTVKTRSWTPGMTLLTPALTPVCSRSSATFFPALPMMTPASLVLTRARRVKLSLPAGEGERDWGAESAGVYLVRKRSDLTSGSGTDRCRGEQGRRKAWRGRGRKAEGERGEGEGERGEEDGRAEGTDDEKVSKQKPADRSERPAQTRARPRGVCRPRSVSVQAPLGSAVQHRRRTVGYQIPPAGFNK